MTDALITAGFTKGLAMGFWRILKCHPWHPGGVDLVRTTHGK
jgi:putative component of membrane protein insertase Oxa1/YidC/SpoIIIJ protein YidD